MRTCYSLKPQLNVVVAYICVTHGSRSDTHAARFTSTYLENPSEYPHRLIIVCNGGSLSPALKNNFNGLDCEFYIRGNDDGKDISAFQEIAKKVSCDFLICLGESITIRGPNWIDRMMQSRLRMGPGMYGFFSSHIVRAHLNTTAFAIDPDLLVRYPPVDTNAKRYDFEHGPGCLWQRVYKSNLATVFVTWDGDWLPGHWRDAKNILSSGDQSNLLVWSHHCDEFSMANEPTKSLWRDQSNLPFHF